MPLILAIEPDKRQASRIGAIGRSIGGAELLIADSVDRAIAVLGGRVPDLLLTSLLLSPKEEARLRELNGDGVSIQTLVIPVLASPSRRATAAVGLLTRLRAPKGDHGQAEGCDPAVFAAQISEYLEHLEQDRKLDLDSEERTLAPEPQPSSPQEEPVAQNVREESGVQDSRGEHAVWDLQEEPVAQQQMSASGEHEVSALADPPDSNALWEEIALEDGQAESPIELSSEPIDLERFMSELEVAAELLELSEPFEPLEPLDPLELFAAASIPRVVAAHPLSRIAAWPSLQGVSAEERANDPLIAEFMVALNGDETDQEDEPEGDTYPDSDLWMPLPAEAQTLWPRMPAAIASSKSGGRADSVQDEWGFFDPERCGFGALLAKLQEINK